MLSATEMGTMRVDLRNLAIAIAIAAGGTSLVRAQSAVDQLQPLVETSAHRLALAKAIAAAKWESGTAVEDRAREERVIADAVKEGESRKLDATSVSNFFKAQIEANKVIQYSLLADWHRAGGSSFHSPGNLVTTIRPQLDQLQTALIAELSDTAAARAASTCPANVAQAVGKYVSMHEQYAGVLYRISLDRALAAACTP
jgi:chorismate mutase